MIKCSISDSSIMDTVILPSRGYFYKDLLPNGEVTVHSMITQDEMLLAGGGQIEQRLDLLLSRRVDLPETLKSSDLLVSDRFFLMMILRALSYGSTYSIMINCPSCRTSFKYDLDIIKDIEVNYLPDGMKEREPFSVKLPISGNQIELRHLRGSDEIEAEKYAGQKLKEVKNQQGDPAYIYSLARRIVSINGNQVDMISCMRYVEELKTKDKLAVMKTLNRYESGIRDSIGISCKKCSRTIQTDIPITQEFFRPDIEQ